MQSPFSKKPPTKSRRAFAAPSHLSSPFSNLSARRSYISNVIDSPSQSISLLFPEPILDECSQHTILPHGNPLPVLVTEAFTERISDVSIKLEDSGWASLVCGRRLLIWKFRQDVSNKSVVTHCRELTLPQSGLSHKADLVQVSISRESQSPSAIAVSPEGIVRYWPNIVHEGFSAEASTDTSGQECYLLTSIEPLGFIVATTTCSLVLITPTTSDGQHAVICRTLKFPQSVLAGISKRVSSFIFGAIPSQNYETKQLIQVLSTEGDEKNSRFLFVLSSTSLQKWRLTEDEPDQLMFEEDLDRSLKERLLKSIWQISDATQLHQVKNWCLDMQLIQNGVAVLVAAMNPNSSHMVYYAFALIDVSSHSAEVTSFLVLQHSEVRNELDMEDKMMNYKFIIPSMNSQIVYLYNHEKVIFFRMSEYGNVQELIDVNSCGSIIGSGVWNGSPLFFTQFHGLLLLQNNQSSFLNSGLHRLTPPREMILKDHQASESDDSLQSKLMSALCLYCKDIDKCQEIIRETFSTTSLSNIDSGLDNAAIYLSTQVINDYPASDPRWCESIPKGDSLSSSLIILHQLEDKVRVHNYVIEFLKAVGLFDRLSTVNVEDGKVLTKAVLCEHAEKIKAAQVIRGFVVDYPELLDLIIKKTLALRKIDLKGSLTYQDLFFREVSEIHFFFRILLEHEEHLLANGSQETIQLVSTVNKILVGVNATVLEFRQANVNVYGITKNGVQFLPWTSSEGPGGMRTLLLQQHTINIQYMMRASDDIQVQGMIYQQIVDIINFILNGFCSQLESIKETEYFGSLKERFKKERNKLIRPLLEVGQYDRAAYLAEKYLDFDVLVQLCEDTKNQERLQRYVLQYKEEDFSDFMFKWYLDKGMRNRLLKQPVGQQDDLTRFLEQHHDLSWLHDMNNGKFRSAQQTLGKLAVKETGCLSKKKTLLSLSKLAALASDYSPDVKEDILDGLNGEQDLILHQENLPDTIVEAYELDPDTMHVLRPEELIEMYISEENTAANAYDFKIALELLQFVNKPPGDVDYENLRMHIWCKAILRDNWEDLDANNPLEAVQSTIFFQIIELAFHRGVDLHTFIVSVDDLLASPEISSLADNPTFIFFIRAGYEQIYKLID